MASPRTGRRGKGEAGGLGDPEPRTRASPFVNASSGETPSPGSGIGATHDPRNKKYISSNHAHD